MTELDTAWLAGLFEGEGSIVRNDNGRNSGRVVLTLRMCDEDVVRRAHAVAGVGVVNGPYTNKGARASAWRPFWQWSVGRQEHVAELLETMLPYFGERRCERAAAMISHVLTRRAA